MASTKPRRRQNGSGERRPVRSRSSGVSGLLGAAGKGALVAVCLVGIYLSYQRYRRVQAQNERTRLENEKIREHNRNLYDYEVRRGPRYVKPAAGVEKSGSLGSLRKSRPPAPKATTPAETSTAFTSLRKQGNELFFAGKFREAAQVFAKALDKPAPAASKAKLKEAAAACREFASLTADIKPSVEAKADNLYLIKLKTTGSVLRARVIDQNAKGVWYVKDHLRGQLPRQVIESMVPVKQEDLDREKRRKLDDLVSDANAEDDVLAYYLAASKALEFAFPRDAARLLRKAHDLAKQRGDTLGHVVREYRAYKLFKYGAYYYSAGVPTRGRKKFEEIFEKYPGTRAAKNARETLDEITRRQKELVYINRRRAESLRRKEEQRRKRARDAADRKRQGARPSIEEKGAELAGIQIDREGGVKGKDMALISKANSLYDKGAKENFKGMSVASARKSNQHYKNAIKYLERAVELYNKALKKDPNNRQLQNRLQSAATKLYWAKKSKRYGM